MIFYLRKERGVRLVFHITASSYQLLTGWWTWAPEASPAVTPSATLFFPFPFPMRRGPKEMWSRHNSSQRPCQRLACVSNPLLEAAPSREQAGEFKAWLHLEAPADSPRMAACKRSPIWAGETGNLRLHVLWGRKPHTVQQGWLPGQWTQETQEGGLQR